MATITLPNGAKVTLPDKTPVPAKQEPTFLGETSRVMSAVNEDYLAPTLGAPVDAVNWLLGGVGLGSEKPFMGSDWLTEKSRDIGASNELRPETTIGKYAAAGLGGVGAGLVGAPIMGGGLMAGGRALGSQAMMAAGRATMATPIADAVAGAGAAMGGQAARDIVPGSPTAEIAGQFLGALVPGGLAQFGKTAGNQVLKAMDNLGIDPTMGTAGVGGKTSAFVQNNALAQAGGSSGTVGKALDRTLQQTENALHGVAAKYGQPIPSRIEAGQELQKHLTDWFDRVKMGTGKVYEDIAQQFGPNDIFHATATMNALKNPAGKIDNAALAKQISDPQIGKFLEALETSGGNLSYNDMKLFRSHVGAQMDPRAISNIDQKQLKTLYGALSDDLGAAVDTLGPKVAHRWRTTNAFYANAMEKFKDQFERMVGGKNKVTGEEAYKLLLSAGEGNFDRFKETWNVLSPEQRGDYAATILSRMGRGEDGAVGEAANWSVLKFLRDYDKLSGQAKALVFRSTGNGEAEKALDSLLTVVKSLEQNVEKVKSTSRSGAMAPMIAQVGAVAAAASQGDAMSAIAALTGPYVAAKIMTNPAATRTLAWALRAMQAGGAPAAKASLFLQSFGVPTGPKEPMRITVPNPGPSQP